MKVMFALLISISLLEGCSSKSAAEATGATDTTDLVKNATKLKIFGKKFNFTTNNAFKSNCGYAITYSNGILDSKHTSCSKITMNQDEEVYTVTASDMASYVMNYKSGSSIKLNSKDYYCYEDTNDLSNSDATHFSTTGVSRLLVTSKKATKPSDLDATSVVAVLLPIEDCANVLK